MSKKHSMDVGMAEAEPAQTEMPPQPVAENKEFINPVYVADDPMLGRAGTRAIYRWSNAGATVVHDYRPASLRYTFTPVEFTGDEITSFVPAGESTGCSSEEEVQALLHKHKV